MKKIINGKVYDTDKARNLGSDSYSYSGDFHHWAETLYQKRTGEFFLYGEGGPMTKYAVSCGQNQWSGGEKILPLDVEAARQWAEEHLEAEDYEEIFGLPDEDAEPVALHMMLPAQLAAAARQRAAEDGVPLTRVVETALAEYLDRINEPKEVDPMKHWYLIDDCMSTRSFRDEDKLNVNTRAEAVREATRRWESLSPKDQRDRDAYYVCYAAEDEDGCLDYDTATDEYTLK